VYKSQVKIDVNKFETEGMENESKTGFNDCFWSQKRIFMS
jgi:hypothetical protein